MVRPGDAGQPGGRWWLGQVMQDNREADGG